MAVRKINTEIALGGEKQFNDQMKAVNSNLKTLKSEMALVTAQFADNANSTEALEAKHALLTQQAEQQKEVVRNLNEMVKRSVEVNGEDAAATDKWRMQLNSATADLIKKERELAANEKAQKDLVSAQEEAAKAAEEEAKAQVEAAKAAEEEAKAQVEAAKAAEKEAKSLKHKIEQLKDNEDKASKLTEKYRSLSKWINNVKSNHEAELKVLGKIADATKIPIKALGKLAAAGTVATGAVAALAIEGISTLTQYAKEAAESGDPAFANLSENLMALDRTSKSAKAALGSVLLPALTSLSGGGVKLLNDFSNAMAATNGDTEQMGEVISEYLGKAIELIRQNLPLIMKLGEDLIEGLGKGLIDNAPEMLDDAGKIVGKLLEGLAKHAPDIAKGAVQLIKILSDTLIQSAPDLILAGGELVISLIEALPELITTLIDGFLSPENLNAIKDIGVGIVKAIWNGITSMLGWLWEKVQNIFKGKKISAPEIDYDNFSGGGGKFAGGLDYVPYDNFPALLHKGETVLTAVEADAYRHGGGGSGGKTVNVTFYAQQVSEADVDMIVDTVNRRLGED